MTKILVISDLHGRGFGKNHAIIGQVKLYS